MSTEAAPVHVHLANLHDADFPTRFQEEERYFQTPIFEATLVPDARNVVLYYDKRIVLPVLPENAKSIKELSYGLLAVYDDHGAITGLIDFPEKFFADLTKEALTKHRGVSPFFIPSYIDFSQVKTDPHSTQAFTELFQRREITLGTQPDELENALEFCKKYEEHGDYLAGVIYAHAANKPNHKAVNFKTNMRTWEYLSHLRKKYADDPSQQQLAMETFERACVDGSAGYSS